MNWKTSNGPKGTKFVRRFFPNKDGEGLFLRDALEVGVATPLGSDMLVKVSVFTVKGTVVDCKREMVEILNHFPHPLALISIVIVSMPTPMGISKEGTKL